MREGEFKVKFLREGQIERAFPKDSPKGGFWIERIPPGTIKRMSARSVAFWRGRDPDMLEILAEPDKGRTTAPQALTESVAVVPDAADVWGDECKAEMRRAIDAVLAGAADIETVMVLRPDTIPGVDLADVGQLAVPFAAPAALKRIRVLVRGRPGRRPKHATT